MTLDRSGTGRHGIGDGSVALGSARLLLKFVVTLSAATTLLLGGAEGGLAQGIGTIVGRVVNATNGEPIGSAEVSVVGTSFTSVTAPEGWYIIQGVPAGTYEISASGPGYASMTQEVKVVAGAGAMVEFALQVSLVPLDELVVSGAVGSESRREVGSSIASIEGERLERQAGVGLGTALQGQIAGLQVFSGGGQAGAGKILRLRGINSLVNTEPLVYLDGIRLGRISQSAPDQASQIISVLDMLNVEDIARIEVLRGSAATAMYGTDAAGGVILIYTK